MLVETKHFAFDLPEGYVDQSDGDSASYVDQEARREICISCVIAKEEAGIDDVLQELADARLDVLKKNGAAEHAMPLVFSDRNDLRIASFLAVGRDPLVTSCAIITHTQPALGQRCVVALSVYQYFKPGAGAPVVDLVERFAKSVADTVEPMPQRKALQRSEGAAIDPTRFYPYLVPAGYLERRSPSAPKPKSLGHGISIALAEDFEGAARIHYAEDLESLGSTEALLRIAQSNLARAASERRVTMQGFEGPRGLPVMIFGPEWLAAGCLLLPDLHAFAGQHLGGGPLCASVPHRDAMLIFRHEDPAYRREIQALIAKNEANPPKPLTNELFTVTANGIEPLA